MFARYVSRFFAILTIISLGIASTASVAHRPVILDGNKVQYDKFDFKILKTQHFDVYFYPEMEKDGNTGRPDGRKMACPPVTSAQS